MTEYRCDGKLHAGGATCPMQHEPAVEETAAYKAALARVYDAHDKSMALHAVLDDLRGVRDCLKGAGFTARRSPLLRRVMSAMKSAEGAIRNQSSRLSWAQFQCEELRKRSILR